MMRHLGVFGLALATVVSATCGGSEPEVVASPADPTAEPQTHSLFGEPLYAMADTTGQIAQADSALAEEPDNVELVIAAARVRRNFWQYRDAMDLYTRAMEMAPEDWRPYRFRGHRYISLRDFEAAITDLETARSMAPLNWDVSYHLGLAYFLAGRFDDAADEYVRCLELGDDEEARAAQSDDFRSCSQNVDDPESQVAMTEWAVRAAMRSGRTDTVDELLDGITADMPVSENVAYHHDLLMYKGVMDVEELLNPGPEAPYRLETVGFGVANWMLSNGEDERAVELLRRLFEDPWWPGFGRIAAEVELARIEGV